MSRTRASSGGHAYINALTDQGECVHLFHKNSFAHSKRGKLSVGGPGLVQIAWRVSNSDSQEGTVNSIEGFRACAWAQLASGFLQYCALIEVLNAVMLPGMSDQILGTRIWDAICKESPPNLRTLLDELLQYLGFIDEQGSQNPQQVWLASVQAILGRPSKFLPAAMASVV